MKKAARRDGALENYPIDSATPIPAADIPCTELGRCFRKDLKYALFAIRSEYQSATPAQPEFAVMTMSDEGWRFGGGSFLNRPLGQIAVIMTVQDERRYKPAVSIRR